MKAPGETDGDAGPGAWAGAGSAARPHSPQNFAVGDNGVPQLAQCRGRGVPHVWQNFAGVGLSEPQPEQRM